MVNQAARTQDETIQFAVLVQLLDTVEQTRYHIVTARSLTTRQDNTYLDSRIFNGISFNELNQRHTVCVREQSLDGFLISNRLGCFAFLCDNGAFQRLRKFWLISSSGNLQCTFCHIIYNLKGLSSISFLSNSFLYKRQCKFRSFFANIKTYTNKNRIFEAK